MRFFTYLFFILAAASGVLMLLFAIGHMAAVLSHDLEMMAEFERLVNLAFVGMFGGAFFGGLALGAARDEERGHG